MPSKTTIRDAQKRILDFLDANPHATIPEIMAEFGFASANTVHYHVRRLEEAGLLERPRLEWKVKRR